MNTSRLLIGISGFNASGKTALTKRLITHLSASSNRFSLILADVATDLNLSTDKEPLQHLSTVLREKLGEDILARGMSEWVKRTPNEAIVIEGIRRIVDIELLEKTARETGRAWHFFFIDAPYDLRFERINARFKEEGKPEMTKEAFYAIENQECEIELPELKRRAHAVIDNSAHSLDETFSLLLSHIQK